jgi:transcriptional regulator with XRE-family HTH domain
MTAFSDKLRVLLEERGISLGELARISHYDKGYLSRVVRGKMPGSPDLAAVLDKALCTDGELEQLFRHRRASPGSSPAAQLVRAISTFTLEDLAGARTADGPASRKAASILDTWNDSPTAVPHVLILNARQISIEELRALETTRVIQAIA